MGMNMVDEREQTSSNTRETPKSSGFQRSGPFLLRGQLGWDCEMQAAIEAKTSAYQERDSVNTDYSCRWPKVSSPEWIASRTGSAWPTSVSLFGIDDGRVTTRLWLHIKRSVHISFEEIGRKDTNIAPRKGQPSKFRVGLKF